ncbi:hypothetical protein R0K19_26785, partial [Bacillus sp. SIMBA_161]
TEAPDESAVVDEITPATDQAEEGQDSGPTEPVEETNEDKAPEIPTAVSLGLLEENFVSRVSTALKFHAPDISLFPPLPVYD